MHILFITRKYPPQVGGMENFSYGLINNIQCEKDTIILNKAQINLIWWLPYALIASLLKARKVDAIHLCDGLLAPIGLLIKKICHKPVSVTVHGLDVTFQNWLYQNINVRCLKYLDKIICVSESTKQDCIEKSIPENKLFTIPDGINDQRPVTNNQRPVTNNQRPVTNNQRQILLTVGRLVKRKGVEWFVREIMPKVDQKFEYWIVGCGPEKDNIEKAIKENNLENKIKLFGFVDEEKIKLLYNQADVFIMPNIKIEGDREGFGIVALEAGIYGLPVLASDIEGIKDVVKNSVNGYLIKPENVQEWIDKIQKMEYNKLLNSDIQQFIKTNFSWNTICEKYLLLINQYGKNRT